MSNENPVIVYVSGRPIEAHMVAGLLQANGILALTTDDHLIALQPFLSAALGGACVRVPAVQATEAREILNEYLGPAQGDFHTGAFSAIEASEPEPANNPPPAPTTHQPDGSILCKNCGEVNEADSNYCVECGSFIKPS